MSERIVFSTASAARYFELIAADAASFRGESFDEVAGFVLARGGIEKCILVDVMPKIEAPSEFSASVEAWRRALRHDELGDDELPARIFYEASSSAVFVNGRMIESRQKTVALMASFLVRESSGFLRVDLAGPELSMVIALRLAHGYARGVQGLEYLQLAGRISQGFIP